MKPDRPAIGVLALSFAVLSLSPASSVNAAVSLERAKNICQKRIADHLAYHHFDPASVDAPVLCDEFAERVSGGVAVEVAWEPTLRRIRAGTYAWAPQGARHAGNVLYRLPYKGWIPRLCSQGPGVGTTDPNATHTTVEDLYAYDFLMPSGTTIHAARDGVVRFAYDGTAEGVHWDDDAGNSIEVLHSDGTFALYAHIQPGGALVKMGDRVRRGQPIAKSGNTGFSRTPHLHFAVRRRTVDNEIRGVPIDFGNPGKPKFQIKPGHHAGGMPKSKTRLRLTVDGKPVGPTARKIVYGAEANIRVERELRDGRLEDITHSRRVRYETMTLWNLHAPEPGRILARIVPGVDIEYVRKAMSMLSQSDGLLFVYFGVPRDRDFGFSQVKFEIVPSSK